MKKRDKIIYTIVKIVFTLLALIGPIGYFFFHDASAEMFESILYPTYLIYPLGVVKLLGLAALWFSPVDTLKEWAYAGFAFVFLLAISAHINVSDGGFPGALMALILLSVHYYYHRKEIAAN